MLNKGIRAYELSQRYGLKMSYTEQLIYTRHKPYRLVDKMLKMWIREYELAPRSGVKMSYIEKLIYTLHIKYDGGEI